MKYIEADKLIKAIEEKGLDCSFALKMERIDTLSLIDSLQQEQPEVFDTAAFQKGVQEGRRLEREDAEHLRDATKKISEDLALTIADIEKLHTFLYAVKNNKHGAFTFTRLTDEQYKEVLRRFNKTKEQ